MPAVSLPPSLPEGIIFLRTLVLWPRPRKAPRPVDCLCPVSRQECTSDQRRHGRRAARGKMRRHARISEPEAVAVRRWRGSEGVSSYLGLDVLLY